MLLTEEYNLGLILVTCTSKTLRLCAAGSSDRTLIPGNASQSLVVEDGPLSLLCRYGSNPVAEQSLTIENGPLSPPGVRQQSSVAEHFLAVEDGFVSLPSILLQSSVPEQF